jgi:ubiquinone biosynthesis protein
MLGPMRIPNIPQVYRNVRRWSEILAVLSRYGLADWLSQFNIEFINNRLKNRDGEILSKHTREARIRMALTDLGPSFIKLGQLLSTRSDLVGVNLATELRTLQTDVPADSSETVRQIVEEELGQPIDRIFIEFADKPLASASIGQVHLARLFSGQQVVVKVQHAGIESKVSEDLDVLAGLAQLAEMIPDLARYRPVATAAEFARSLRRELDFGREERNLQQFAALFANNPHLRIPQANSDYCTPRVLTMEYIEGIPLGDAKRLADMHFDLEEIARRGAEAYLDMIFTHGFFHADPHPGNLLVLPGNVIGLLDFGMVGRIDERLREDIEEMLMALVNQDVAELATIIRRIGEVPSDLNDAAFRSDVADFVGTWTTRSLDRFDLGGALNDLIDLIHRYKILLPAQIGLLLKVLISLEGTAKLLSPRFSLIEVMKPYQRSVLLRRLSPARQLRKLRRVFNEFEQLAEVLPRHVIQILEQVQAGKFDVHLEHRGLSPSVNRLVLGMLASALFLGSSLMLANKVPPLLFPTNAWLGIKEISMLGLAGCVTSILIGLRLLRAIGKSGHLDNRDQK